MFDNSCNYKQQQTNKQTFKKPVPQHMVPLMQPFSPSDFCPVSKCLATVQSLEHWPVVPLPAADFFPFLAGDFVAVTFCSSSSENLH